MSAPTTSNSAFDIANLYGVSGKKVLVTGGGSGIGSYIALGYALNGASVYVVGRREEKLKTVTEDFEKRQKEKDAPATAKQGKVIPLVGDVSSKEGIKTLADSYGKHEQHLDVLVNNAGTGKELPIKADKDDAEKLQESLWSEEQDTWTQVLNLNTTAPYFCSIAFITYLSRAAPISLSEPGPSIINITSIAAHHVNRDVAIGPSYNASKAAAEKITKTLSSRLQPWKIRCNAIAPGLFPSELTAPTPEGLAEKMPQMMANIPAGRSGTPEDVAGLAIMLGSRAGAYLNGTSVTIDGGRLLVVSAK